MQNCKDIRVVLDCPILQKSSKLQQFKVKDCDRLEFITLSSNSLIQTPPEFIIENVKEIVSLPRNIFKSPISNTELKCMGTSSMRKIRVFNSKINIINTKAIHNVSGIKSVEFENVTIDNIETRGLEIIMGYDNTFFTLTNSKLENLNFNSITVQSSNIKITNNNFGNMFASVMNMTSDTLLIQGNAFNEINANGIITHAVRTEITDNVVKFLKANALSGIKCSKKRLNNQLLSFILNRFEKVESNSLYFNYGTCKSSSTPITYRDNKVDCTCRNIGFLNTNSDINNIILNVSNNNTCLLTSCNLPVDIVKLLIESDMCHINLDPQVMCLLYNDKHASKNETDEEVTEAEPTFYLIRQANSLNGDASAAMTVIDKDDLLKDSHLNMTNRTTIKVVFDSSKDFVETLRSTSSTSKKFKENKSPPSEEYINRCIGEQCRNTVSYDKQKALDFYKYVYAQLRTPRQEDSKKSKS